MKAMRNQGPMSPDEFEIPMDAQDQALEPDNAAEQEVAEGETKLPDDVHQSNEQEVTKV